MKKFKLLFTFILSFIVSFINISPSYANTNNENNMIKLENNFQKTSFQIARDLPTEENKSDLWIASFIIPGLGQILMGDGIGGLKFLIGVPVAFFIPLLIMSKLPNAFENLNFSITLAFILVIIVHIWNITDSYALSEELKKVNNKKVKLSDNNNLFQLDLLSYNF